MAFFPTWELKSLIFLIGLLSNRLPWYKLKILEILYAVIPDIDTSRPEIANQDPDLISPLLTLLETEYCPQALEIIDHIITMSATPMDKHHMRTSMASAGSQLLRKEDERTSSLYGTPEETGWSIPTPAIHSNITRLNMQAVFYSCVTINAEESPSVATPEVEFHREEYSDDSYFPIKHPDSPNTENTLVDADMDGGTGDLVSKLDSLDNFFEDSLTSDPGSSMPYPDLNVPDFNADPESGADFYDQQTAPILYKSLARTGSVTSLNTDFLDRRGPLTRDPGIMTPTAFTTDPAFSPFFFYFYVFLRDQDVRLALVEVDAHHVAGAQNRETAIGGGFRPGVQDRRRT